MLQWLTYSIGVSGRLAKTWCFQIITLDNGNGDDGGTEECWVVGEGICDCNGEDDGGECVWLCEKSISPFRMTAKVLMAIDVGNRRVSTFVSALVDYVGKGNHKSEVGRVYKP